MSNFLIAQWQNILYAFFKKLSTFSLLERPIFNVDFAFIARSITEAISWNLTFNHNFINCYRGRDTVRAYVGLKSLGAAPAYHLYSYSNFRQS